VRHRAYEDAPLPIGSGQTISQPSIHARYLEVLALKGQERVLEIGTGSGYQTVLLSHLVAQIFTIERIAALYTMARDAIARAGAKNVSMLLGDGTVGWREYAPYDAILVSAGGPSIPQPLIEQLADGGRMLVPIGPMEEQTLKLVTRRGTGFETTDVAPVRFVPLYGTHGWEQQ
jgi:protein-L-isoaspartate(D-aspartate) O-methyltransferase